MGMADVSFERKKVLSREEAAVWLSALSRSFAHGGEAALPVGGGGTITLHMPDEVRAEFEVEIKDGEVEVELEFSWSLAPSTDDASDA
jgi:amphi-Trp domain-containing protein